MVKRTKPASEAKAYRFDVVCEKKRVFKSEAEALSAAEFGMLENMSLSLGVYQCPTCRNWHLTRIESSKHTE